MSQPQTATPQAATPQRRLDRKLTAILDGRYTPDDFVIADAKDADMAFGVAAPGPIPGAPAGATGPGRYRTRVAYLDAMRALVKQGELDILLTSASNGEQLAADGSLNADITLAIRANDTTDIWNHRGSDYTLSPVCPFRTADLAAIRPFCDLVLYAVTFNNDLDHDVATLEAYGRFRREAAGLGMRHFLEVFSPNAPVGLDAAQVGAFVNDSIIRTLAGVVAAQRPLFLKMAYNGADARPSSWNTTHRWWSAFWAAGRYHPGHVRAAAPGGTARRPRRTVRPQDPAGRVAAGPGRPDAPGAAR